MRHVVVLKSVTMGGSGVKKGSKITILDDSFSVILSYGGWFFINIVEKNTVLYHRRIVNKIQLF